MDYAARPSLQGAGGLVGIALCVQGESLSSCERMPGRRAVFCGPNPLSVFAVGLGGPPLDPRCVYQGGRVQRLPGRAYVVRPAATDVQGERVLLSRSCGDPESRTQPVRKRSKTLHRRELGERQRITHPFATAGRGAEKPGGGSPLACEEKRRRPSLPPFSECRFLASRGVCGCSSWFPV